MRGGSIEVKLYPTNEINRTYLSTVSQQNLILLLFSILENERENTHTKCACIKLDKQNDLKRKEKYFVR